jgi:XTP/dITP diphosphohydrolase
VFQKFTGLSQSQPNQDKVKGVGFDWEEPHQVWDKVQEELEELQVEVKDQDKIEAEFGDVLFSMINYARFLNVNPEDALERTNKKIHQTLSISRK